MNTKLDKWDFQLIRSFKWATPEDPCTPAKLKKIWGKRCGLDFEYCELRDINEHLLGLIYDLNLFASSPSFNSYKFKEFINHLDSERNYWYICTPRPYLKTDTTDFQLILLSRLDSFFCHTRVKDLPGYREFWEKEICS